MHGSVVMCVTVNGSVKRFTGCDTSDMIITWCVRVDGLLGVSGLQWIACLVCPSCSSKSKLRSPRRRYGSRCRFNPTNSKGRSYIIDPEAEEASY